MRRVGTESGLLGFCRKLTRDVLQFANPLRPTSGKLPRANNFLHRSLGIEPLEVRNYLSGASIAAQVDPVWFQEVAGGTLGHAGTADWTAEGISSASTQPATATGFAPNTYDWIVQFTTADVSGVTNIAQTAALLAGGGVQFQAICGLGIVGQVLVRSSGASLGTVEHWLAADAHVATYEEDAVRQIESTPNDPSLNQLWGMSKIDAYDAWNLTTGASGANRVVVAEIDTGVDYTDSDLAANIWTNPNAGHDGFGNDIHGYNFADNNSDPMDDNGHGTHVAGTIGAVGNNGLGVVGVNWSVAIMPLKFMSASGSGYLSDAIRAINYATMERTQYGVNVRVINASWGGGGYSAAMQTAIQAAGNAGILFVAAAGNSGTNNDVTPQYPASYSCTNIVAVAATDQNDRLASFSCYGATSVDIAAPGVSIYSTLPHNRYGILSGTSMATPQVAGAAALAWAIDPTATVAEVRNALLQGVDHLSTLSGKVASGGRLNVFHTLQLLEGANTAVPTIATLSPSLDNVLPGTSIKLVATGATTSAGSVTAVYFYQDTNGNGVWDAGDACLGAVTSVAGGTASLQVNTANWPAGTYRFFAQALGSNNKFSAAATTTLTVAPANIPSSASSATMVAVGGNVAGNIETGGNAEWYQFQAVAGTSYTIRTQLTTLRDSVLYLYNRDGKTQLAWNDDGDVGLASRIDWVAPATGTYFFKVTGFDKTLTGTFRVSVVANATSSVSAKAADIPSAPAGFSIPAPASNAATAASVIAMAAWQDRFATFSAGLASSIGGGEGPDAIPSDTRSTSTTFAAESRESAHTATLLDRHPGLRSVVGGMFLEDESGAANVVTSLHVNLDALDALFARMADGESISE